MADHVYTNTQPFLDLCEENRKDLQYSLESSLRRIFGSVAVRGISEYEWEDLLSLCQDVSMTLVQDVQTHYLIEAVGTSQQHTLNVLRGVMAGQAAAVRDLTGQEPDPTVVMFVTGKDGGS